LLIVACGEITADENLLRAGAQVGKAIGINGRDFQAAEFDVQIAEARRGEARDLVTVTVTVKNTGSREGAEVVQCYVRNLGASMEQPVRSLEGFERVTLKPGESRQVSFKLGSSELSFYNNAGHAVIEPTNYTVWVGGSSTAEAHDEFRITP